MNDDWVVWQLADATFPSGGFAHSGGLEAVVQWGGLGGAERLVELLQMSLLQSSRSQVPLVTTVHREPDRVREVDQFCHAFLSNHVANRASRSQGNALLVSAAAAFDLEHLGTLREEARAGRLQGHLAPIFGAVTSALKLSAEVSAHLFLYMTLRGLIASAVRLGVAGPFQGQAIQFRLGALARQLAERAGQYGLDDIAHTAPVLDVLQATHERLYSRLFQS